jgi:predicted dehydrogenase
MSAVAEKRIALVGVGRASSAYLDVLSDLPELVLGSVVDRVAERTRIAAEWGARAFSSVDEMLAHGRIPDAALVCTPPSTHLEVAEPLLHAGVDCLIESPLATLPADARRVATTAERLGRTLATAARFRAGEALTRARRLIDEGLIGRLSYVEATLSGKLDAKRGWRGDPQISGGGVWTDRGPDAIDVVETVAGPIERIRMAGQRRAQRLPIEDEVAVETEHAGGALSRILLSWNRQITAPIARCVGTEAELLVGWAQAVIRDGDSEEVVGRGFDSRSSCVAVLRRFFARRAKAACEEDHGAQSVDWLQAAYVSLRSRRWEIA